MPSRSVVGVNRAFSNHRPSFGYQPAQVQADALFAAGQVQLIGRLSCSHLRTVRMRAVASTTTPMSRDV